MKLLELEVNQKSYIKILCVCTIVVVMILAIYYISLLSYKPFEIEEETIIADIGEKNMSVHIDSMDYENGKGEIVGWAYKENENIKTINCSYVLKNIENEDMYILRTRHEENLNVPEEYQVSGIHTRFIAKKMPKGRYDVYVIYKNNNNNIFAKTGIYIDI